MNVATVIGTTSTTRGLVTQKGEKQKLLMKVA